MIRVCHVIAGLDAGGAERTLCRLLAGMDREAFENRVISLTGMGPVADELGGLGVPVTALEMAGPRACPGALCRLMRELRRQSPAILQAWMYHANLLGGLAAGWQGGIRVVWNLRRARVDRPLAKRATVWTSRACAALSRRLPARIVCGSRAARDGHAASGYDAARMTVIPNGFDVDEFRPDASARAEVRMRMGLPPEALLVGLVARFDPAKDHATFVRAAGLVAARRPQIRFVLCGRGVTGENPVLTGWIRDAGLGPRIHLLGARDDVARLMAALDIAVSSSVVEGFPNAVGEAMATAVPCAVTDAGDSRWLVGNTGEVVPPGDAPALLRAIERLADAGAPARRALGEAARGRIIEHFSLPRMTRRYESLYKELSVPCAA